MEAYSTFNLSLIVNGQRWSGEVPIEETLLELLRNRLRLTGTKRSCESEVCGACTILVEKRPVSSCSYLAFEAHQKSVLTIEGMAQNDKLDPLQGPLSATSARSAVIALQARSWRPKRS
jgi:carbon-monoxide dehydrogenase small subunit